MQTPDTDDPGRPMSPGRARAERWLLAVAGIALLLTLAIFALIPIVVAVVLSFSDDRLLRFPVTGWSLRWYKDFFGSNQFMRALQNSLIIATGTVLLSVPIGTLAAWTLRRHFARRNRTFGFVLMLPLFVPGVVLGLGLAVSFGQTDILGWQLFGSRAIIVLGHSLWAMPLVFMIMETAFHALDPEIVEASADLGASTMRTAVEIVLPGVSVALLASTLFSFVISLNEFYMALFLSTRDTQTLPVLMWLSLRSAGTPRLAVAAVTLLFVVVMTLLLVFLLTRKRGRSVPFVPG